MIFTEPESKVEYPRTSVAEDSNRSFTVYQWGTLFVILFLPSILRVLSPVLKLPYHTYFVIFESLSALSWLPLILVSRKFQGGGPFRETWSRVKTRSGGRGLFFALLLPISFAFAVLYQAKELPSYALNLPFLNPFEKFSLSAYLLYSITVPLAGYVANCWMYLLILGSSRTSTRLAAIGFQLLAWQSAAVVGTYYRDRVYGAQHSTNYIYSVAPFSTFNLVATIVDGTIWILYLLLLERQCRPSLKPVVLLSLASFLESLVFKYSSGWLAILNHAVPFVILALVTFVSVLFLEPRKARISEFARTMKR